MDDSDSIEELGIMFRLGLFYVSFLIKLLQGEYLHIDDDVARLPTSPSRVSSLVPPLSISHVVSIVWMEIEQTDMTMIKRN